MTVTHGSGFLGTGKGGIYCYYACSRAMKQSRMACRGRRVRMDQLDGMALGHLSGQLFAPERLSVLLEGHLAKEKDDALPGAAIETANIGCEGAFGLFAAVYSRVSFNRCLVQLEGAMVRCPIELLRLEFEQSEQVRDLFVSYSETQLSQVQQTVACNAMHTTERECADGSS